MSQTQARKGGRPATGRGRRVAPAWAALAATLAACAPTGFVPTPRSVEPAAAVSAGAVVAARSTVGRWRPGTVPGAAFAHAGQARVAPPAVDDDPVQLMGLDRVAVEKLLGRARVVRREAPAEIWQYRAGGCVLDLFLFTDGGGYRVVYLEARTVAAQPAESRYCLNAVLSARRSPTTI